MKRRMKTQDQMIKKEKFARQEFPALLPKNENQKKLLEALKYNSIIIAESVAGTGKSLLSCWHAAKKLHYGDIKKVVLLRAYQPLAGRTIGFVPGDATLKLLPYYQQMVDYFEDFLGKGTTEIHLKQGTIEICSLETIRGRSWEDAIVIVDEAQNLFIPEVQALVTRLGDNSQMIFCGDNSGLQTDVKNGMDGLTYLHKVIEKYQIPDTAAIRLTRDDICRSDITRDFVIAFEDELIAEQNGTAIISKIDIDKQHKKTR